jgi:hypothetical protein
MNNDELEQRLRMAEIEVKELKSHSDRLYGQLLGLAACVSASNADFSKSDAESLLSSLAGMTEIPKELLVYANYTIDHVLNARSSKTK